MRKNCILKLFVVLMLMSLFSAPGYANLPDNAEDKPYDIINAEEAAEELRSRQDMVRGEDGVFRPFANIPLYPFGGTQNVTEAAWPVSMRQAMANAVPQEVKDRFKTPAFDYGPGKHSISEDIPGNVGYFTSQQEMLDWFAALPTDRMKYKLITGFPYFTGNGPSDYALARTFEIIFAVFSKPSVFSAEEVKALGKPVIWLQGQIHGRESSPGEALLQIAKEFAEGQHDDILDKVTVLIIPRVNVDGAWNAQRTTTGGAPFGHGGRGSAGIDMNRDFVAFETPIVRAMRQLHMAYDPILISCGHEMGYQFDQEYARSDAGAMVTNSHTRGYTAQIYTIMTYNLNVDKRVRDLGFYMYEPEAKRVLEENGLEWNWYPAGNITSRMYAPGQFPQTVIPLNEVVSRDGISGPLSGEIRYTTGRTDFALVPDEGGASNGAAIANQSLGFVFEAAAQGGNNSSIRLDYLRRTWAQYLGIMSLCRTSANRVDEIMSAIKAARETEIAKTEPLSFWGLPPAPMDDIINVLEYNTWKRENTPEVVNSIRRGTRPIKSIRGHFATRDPNASVTRPIAYIIPKDNYEGVMRAFYSGAKFERLTSDQSIEVEAYTVTSTGPTNSNYNNPGGATDAIETEIKSVTKAIKTITFPKDSFVVRMDQLGASLVGLILEPLAIRNYGNMYLSRTRGASGNLAQIPDWYRETYLPVSQDQEFPSYRYVNSVNNPITTYPANMNIPMMLTMVQKVHAFTQEEVAEIKNELGLNSNPKYISKFELPALSTDITYKKMADVHLDESFVLPNGDVVKIDEQNVLENNQVIIVAPKGLDGTEIYAAKKGGGFVKIFQKELEPVAPGDVLLDGKAPTGAEIVDKALVWTTPLKEEGVILANSMLDGYKIAYVSLIPAGSGYNVIIDGDKAVAFFDKNNVAGKAEIYLLANDSHPADGYDKLLIVEFQGGKSSKDDETGCNVYPLFGIIALIPFIAVTRRFKK